MNQLMNQPRNIPPKDITDLNIKLVIFFGLIVIVVCGVIITSNSLKEYRKIHYTEKNNITIILLTIITPIINQHMKKSIKKIKLDENISLNELDSLVCKVYDTIQSLETIEKEHKKLLDKETIKTLITPYYKQIVYQTVSIEKYYANKYKKKDN